MAILSGITFWSFGLYIGPLEDEFGWSRAEASLGSSFALLPGGLVAPLIGKLVDLRGPRFSIIVGAALSVAGYLLLSTTDSLLQWYLYNALLSVTVQMMFFIPFLALISRWFDARRGLAISLVDIGFLLGGSMMVPLVRYVIDSEGWQAAFVVSALLVAFTTLPVGVLQVRDSPRAAEDRAERSRSNHGSVALMLGVPLLAALRMPFFWLIALGFSFYFYGVVGWTVHQVPFWESHGYSRGEATLIVALAPALSVLFRVSFGVIADRFSRYELSGSGFCLLLAFSTLVLLVETGPVGVGVFIFLWIIGSATVLVEPLMISRSFGVTTFATILGSIVFIETVLQIPAPPLAGFIFDSTGSYDLALVMFSLAFLVASALFALASRLRRPLDYYTPVREGSG